MARWPLAALAAPVLLLALALGGCGGPGNVRDDDDFELPPEDLPLQPVPYADMDRYMGRWYMIANIPYFAEAGNVAVHVEYSRLPDGAIQDLYTARDRFDLPPFTKTGRIEVLDTETMAAGRITFLGPLWQDYAIVFLDPDYRHTVIAHPSRDYAWVFSRTPRMPDAAYAAALQALRDNGFNTERVLKIPQFPEDLAAPGFQ